MFLLGFRRVSPLLVYFRRVSLLLVFLLGFSCQQIQDELAVIMVLSVCVIEFLGHASCAHDGREQEGPQHHFLVRVRGVHDGREQEGP